MHAENRARMSGRQGHSRRKRRPRVVIFLLSDRSSVEVLELPEDAAVGDAICHDGRNWRVTDVRTGARVLIAEPEAN
jgi:hypothetical protein